jgi:hypothetical protein
MALKKDGFFYHLCVTLGWLLIIGGLCWVIFLLLANNSSGITGGITAIIAGILIAMLAERNIFKALITALSHLLQP